MNVTTTLILLLLTAHYLLANLNKSKPLLCIFVLILVKFIINVYCFIGLCIIHTAQCTISLLKWALRLKLYEN